MGQFCPASEGEYELWGNICWACCSWISVTLCCFHVSTAEDICKWKCMTLSLNGVVRPSVAKFNRFLPHFLSNRPDLQCPKGSVSSVSEGPEMNPL